MASNCLEHWWSSLTALQESKLRIIDIFIYWEQAPAIILFQIEKGKFIEKSDQLKEIYLMDLETLQKR